MLVTVRETRIAIRVIAEHVGAFKFGQCYPENYSHLAVVISVDGLKILRYVGAVGLPNIRLLV